MTSALACTGVVVLNSLQGYRDIDTMVGRVKPSVFFFRSVVPRLPKLFSLTQAVAKNLEQPKASAMGRAVMRFLVDNNVCLEKNAVRHLNIQPDDIVLEVGFGPGLGLEYACENVSGNGKVIGADISEVALDAAQQKLWNQIVKGKVELLHLPVDNLVSLNNDYVDKIFHCNCYYFWPSLLAGSKVLYRVLKPGGLMITTLSLDSIKFADKSGYIPSKNSDPVRYMGALEYAGFKDVKIEYHTDAEFKMDYQCITATKPIL